MRAEDRRRRRPILIAGALALLLVAALLLPPLVNINRYQRQIAASLSASLNRPVEVSDVRLQLLPRPAVQIANFAVEAAPGFGAEPILQCSSVTAAIRLSSLWRGRLEIARISLDEPSLNLERSPDGEWNFASVLMQAYRTPQAPTGGLHAGRQRRFPYIEATSARINFKHGDEKLPFSFLNADVSVWLERPDEWQLRVVAQPARTDIHLSLADTGQVRLTGSIGRAASVGTLPLNLHLEWSKAPLGQVTRMLIAQDLGWRADTSVTAHITGSPDAMGLEVVAAATDLHREFFEPAHPMDLQVHCSAIYRHVPGTLNDLHCLAPMGEGSLDLRGSWEMLHTAQPQPNLQLTAAHIPAATALEMLQHTHSRLSSDLSVSGWIDGSVQYAVPGGHIGAVMGGVASGSVIASRIVMHEGSLDQPLPDLHFVVQPAAPQPNAGSGPTLALLPARLDLGGTQPMVAEAHLSSQGFLLHYSGSGRLKRMVPLARALQLVPAGFQPLRDEGTADGNVFLQGSWTPPLPNDGDQPPVEPAMAGTFSIHGVSVQPGYLAEPVHIANANGVLTPTELRWNAINASFGKQRVSGSLSIPLPCRADCVRRFDLNAAEANLGELAAALRGDGEGVMRGLFSRVRTRGQDWPAVEGTVHVGHLLLGHIDIAPVTAALSIRNGEVQVRSLDGHTLGGVVRASGVATLGDSPAYRTQLHLNHIGAPELSQLLEEQWGPGVLDISGDLTMRGNNPQELSSSAAGTLHWQWSGGALPQLTTSALSRFDRWTGDGQVSHGTLTLLESHVVSDGRDEPMTGTIGSDRSLALKIGDGGPMPVTVDSNAPAAPLSRMSISGTLSAPVIETQ